MKTLALCVLAARPWLRRDVAVVVDALHGPLEPSALHPSASLYEGLLAQARRYLAQQARPVAWRVFFFDSLPDWQQALQDPDHGLRACSQELFILQAEASEALLLPARLRAHAQEAGQPLRCSPHSFLLYLLGPDDDLPVQPSALWPDASTGGLHLRLPHPDAQTRRADLLRVLLDHLDHAHYNRLLARSVDAAERPPTLARALHAFMQRRWPGRWDFHSYTGSVIASFIEGMRQLGQADGRPQLGGVNEHALACAAIAGWQLFGRAYVLAVTSGMVDEFKGTLANLQRTRAPGFIVCADSARGQWHAFQGTVEQAGDGRVLMQARGLPQVYIESPEQLDAGLRQAFAALEKGDGPVVIFASPAVLESGVALDEPGLVEPSARLVPAAQAPDIDPGRWQELLSLVNTQRKRLLWFCGRLSAEERSLVHDIAERAGIALCDGIAHPGSVAAYAGGREQANYLGTLGLYGFSRAVHRYLHQGESLRPVEAQSLFFLKSRGDQICTPFSEGRLARHLHIVQVTNRGQDLAPFADLPLQMDLLDFLQRLRAGLRVDAELLRWRQAALAEARRCPPEQLVDRIETLPMTANYFFHRLGGLLRRLIEEEGLRYHGVYDVGRCGVSALRNVPRTDPGFSGWYGRALMGDALMALPAIALHSPHQVLAFIGDGARALVPDVEQQLLRQMGQRPDAAQANVSVFYLHNGMLSIIQSYIDLRFARDGAAQVHVPWRPRGEGLDRRGPLDLQRRQLLRFDEAQLREDLRARGRLNVFEVQLTHNSSGDGMSLASEGTWSRITPSEEHAP
ncbi:decarboxylase [Mitsuaria sp. WAJ17]|uniref:decarboxylase n=1 Tax=Mitsuaria sp. WAJ17 TaxID=2761452 RepID=UPI0016047462|nr:decarboxylase [Mitsuaria sp. WAJ17]MBB2488042.1 decarboxylase [Mitsuaria sp. WAJ17]